MANDALVYRDYLALVALLDEAESFRVRRKQEVVFEGLKRRFLQSCAHYRSRLQTHCEAYARSNGLPAAEAALAPELYNPICYMTFGRTDFAAIVLVDDLDPVVTITTDIKSPLESVIVGLVPDLDSLALPDRAR